MDQHWSEAVEPRDGRARTEYILDPAMLTTNGIASWMTTTGDASYSVISGTSEGHVVKMNTGGASGGRVTLTLPIQLNRPITEAILLDIQGAALTGGNRSVLDASITNQGDTGVGAFWDEGGAQIYATNAGTRTLQRAIRGNWWEGVSDLRVGLLADIAESSRRMAGHIGFSHVEAGTLTASAGGTWTVQISNVHTGSNNNAMLLLRRVVLTVIHNYMGDTQTVTLSGPQGAKGDKGDPGDPTEFELRGTGSPEGSVAAPPATYYTDTAGMDGVWRWVKTSGTGGAGWEPVVSDTGVIDITAQAAGVSSGSITFQHKNGWNILMFNSVSLTGVGNVNLFPNGNASIAPWAPPTGGVNEALSMGSAGADYRRVAVNFLGGVTVYSVTAGNTLNGSIVWPMNRPMPA